MRSGFDWRHDVDGYDAIVSSCRDEDELRIADVLDLRGRPASWDAAREATRAVLIIRTLWPARGREQSARLRDWQESRSVADFAKDTLKERATA